jgi:hypothetical protein
MEKVYPLLTPSVKELDLTDLTEEIQRYIVVG